MQFQTFNKKRNFINFTVHEKPEMGSWGNENTYSNKIDTIYKYVRGILKNMSLSSLNDKFSFLWVLIFANLTSRNISRIFDFVKMAKKHEIHEKMYLRKLELLK